MHMPLPGRDVVSESLVRHGITARAAVMRALTRAFGEDVDLRETIRILHDVDVEVVGEGMK
ncbi:hypothetical protein RJ40_02520 [Methanofollis aquaemaris]|uniref:Uncharacterized protein n=1 Tax=Methanofollis aquaemaris TaxID=126734 RepID=A0A8A3S3X7_9EURY|nr:hypothetical protein [Methanofollis aquaemaris]QSZ66451.1 hypothetical protein RJ40_02520 [Methanofollis aquaemaris]